MPTIVALLDPADDAFLTLTRLCRGAELRCCPDVLAVRRALERTPADVILCALDAGPETDLGQAVGLLHATAPRTPFALWFRATPAAFRALPDSRSAPAPPDGPFRPRSTVLGTRVRESVVLLDRRTGRYLTLNEVAAEIWERLAEGVSPSGIIDRLSEEYDAPRERIAADVTAQVRRFLEDGLIEPGVAQPGHSPISHPDESATDETVAVRVSRPSYLRCAWLITGIKLRLRLTGYDRTLRWVRRQVEGIRVSTAAKFEAVRAVEWRVAVTGAVYPGRALCLEQSLALYLLLRRQGVAVKYHQGVQPYPFEAHAWITYRGEVLTDVPEHVNRYTKVEEQLP